MNEQTKASRESEVSNQVNQLDKLLEEATITVQDLSTRFSVVLRSSSPVPMPISKEPEELVPLANRLRSLNSKLNLIISQVNHMKESCEL